MNTTHNRGSLEVELPVVTPREIAAYVREGRRLRDEEISKLLRAAGRGLARLFRVVAGSKIRRGREPGAARASVLGFPSAGLGLPSRPQ
jgi:hypothetical protein